LGKFLTGYCLPDIIDAQRWIFIEEIWGFLEFPADCLVLLSVFLFTIVSRDVLSWNKLLMATLFIYRP